MAAKKSNNRNIMELKIPPVLVLAAAAVLMRLLVWLLPFAPLHTPLWLAVLPAVSGAVVIACGIRAFAKAQTTLNPMDPEQSGGIVSDGIYRFSRNPMYLGMVLMLSGCALWLGYAAAWVGVAGFAAYIGHFQIIPEERALAAKFGAEYAAYCRKTRRWL